MSLPYPETRRRMKELGLQVPMWNNQVVVAEALARGIEVSATPPGKRVRLAHAGRSHFWLMGRSSLNTRLAGRAAVQKEVFSRLLRSQGFEAPENAVFSAGESSRAWAWAEPIAPVVVKPSDGLQGTGVHVDLSSWEEFREAFDRVAALASDVLVEHFAPGRDHRALVVDGRVVSVTRRIPANVVGDGVADIAELVRRKNQDRGVVHKKLRLDDAVERHLARQDLGLDSVPEAGRQVFIRGTANLHTGGDVVDATDDLPAEVISFVERASTAVPGLRLAGYDVLLPEASDPAGDFGDSAAGAEPPRPTILEANHNPMISGHHFPWAGSPRDAAGAVLDAMFPETAPERPDGYRIDPEAILGGTSSRSPAC